MSHACAPRSAFSPVPLSSLFCFALLAASAVTTSAQTTPSVPAPTPVKTAPASVATPTRADAPVPSVATPSTGHSPSAVAPPTPDSAPLPEVQAPQPAGHSPASVAPPVLIHTSRSYQDPLNQPIHVPTGAPATVPPPVAVSAAALPVVPAYDPTFNHRKRTDALGSPYIPDDSWVYPAALRLYSLGYLDTAFLSMRPWTRRILLHMIEASQDTIMAQNHDEAVEILAKLKDYLAAEDPDNTQGQERGLVYGVDTAYTRLMGITGLTLRDSYHLGQTISNDYGRPYAPGFNDLTGFSTTDEWGRFSLYVRGEYQHAPAYTGYSYAVANQLTLTDLVQTSNMPVTFYQDTVPYGNTGAQNPFRLDEAALSFHLLGHEISGGKTDAWLGPAMGGAMAWSNNAENIYSFRINRVEPLHVPLLSWLLGPLRYDFFYGSLKGHTVPHNPWVHSEQFSFQPTKNFEFAFQRTVIFGGHGYPRSVPVTLHTFLRSFFSVNDVPANVKLTSADPGARYSDFSFSYRLPFVRDWLTLYADSIAHDDVTPISAPRRAAYRPGIYLSHFPHIPKLDLRVEGVSTDTSTLRSLNGQFNYYEIVQLQGYTNKGFIMGDWIGREAKGGQAWLTYHLSGDEFIQAEFLTKETPKDFIAGGVHQTDVKIDVVKHLKKDLVLDAWYQYETWRAPVYLASPSGPQFYSGGPLYEPNTQHNNIITAQLTWYPKLHTPSSLNGKSSQF
jgi:hypothetical protein